METCGKCNKTKDLCSCGRPLKFATVKDLEAQIDAYFNNTKEDEWTITGLALALDTSRKVLVEYEGRDKYSNAIKKAKLIVENGYEKDLKKSGRSGTIFALKNFDWKDKQEVEHSGGVKVFSSEEKDNAKKAIKDITG